MVTRAIVDPCGGKCSNFSTSIFEEVITGFGLLVMSTMVFAQASDPHYGIMTSYEEHKADQELPCQVYRAAPQSGVLKVVANDMAGQPRLAFEPDKTKPCVTSTGPVNQRGFEEHRCKQASSIKVAYLIKADLLQNGGRLLPISKNNLGPGIASAFRPIPIVSHITQRMCFGLAGRIFRTSASADL